jgi:hypothetical protein
LLHKGGFDTNSTSNWGTEGITLTSVLLQIDIFSYGVMIVHVLSGQWPFPGEAVRVNPRNPNNPNDLVGVTEFDRREEYINLIGNEHPLMTLIQGCLSNSPSHRPTSSEVHQRVSAVAADHPPSFTNRVEMMDRIKTLSEEKDILGAIKDIAIAEKDVAVMERSRSIAELQEARSNVDNHCKSHSVAMEALQIFITDMKADNEYLQVTMSAKEKAYTLEQAATEKEKHAIEERHRSEIKLIKDNHQEEIEALKLSYQLDREALEQKQAFQLRALVEEHRIVKQAMKQQHQAQMDLKIRELSSKDTLISTKSSTIQSLQVKLGQALGMASSKDNLSVFTPGIKLMFTDCAELPQDISSHDCGIMIGANIYIGVSYARKVFKYCINEDSWSPLPIAPVRYARIGYLCKKILLIGGRLLSSEVTADIHEFDEASQQWVKSTSILPMPTARSSVSAVSWSSPPALIVCGGNDLQGRPTSIVEVYHGRTSQWHVINPLPFSRAYMTQQIIDNILYMIGGREKERLSTYRKTVIATSIPHLLDNCLQASSERSPIQWQNISIPDVPNYKSTTASLAGCLLVVGGEKDSMYPPKPESIVSSVHAYCPSTSSWLLVGQLPQPLYSCITATLPTGELLVIGGVTPSGNVTNTTYKCSLSRMY